MTTAARDVNGARSCRAERNGFGDRGGGECRKRRGPVGQRQTAHRIDRKMIAIERLRRLLIEPRIAEHRRQHVLVNLALGRSCPAAIVSQPPFLATPVTNKGLDRAVVGGVPPPSANPKG